MARSLALDGTCIAITRPSGTAAALARKVRELGGTPVLLPGTSLRAAGDAGAARAALRDALACDIAIFTSPSAVRFARRLMPLRSRAQVLAPGTSTRCALQRAGFAEARVPEREDSEGILALDLLQDVRGRRISIIGAAGGRGLLTRELGARGAEVFCAHVYRRLPARLDRRHIEALLRDRRKALYVLWSSAEALVTVLDQLSGEPRRVLLTGTAVVSSARLADAARKASFARQLRADSASSANMLAAVMADRASVGC